MRPASQGTLTALLQLSDGLAVQTGGVSVLACLETFIPSLFQVGPGPGLLFLRHRFLLTLSGKMKR